MALFFSELKTPGMRKQQETAFQGNQVQTEAPERRHLEGGRRKKMGPSLEE